MKKIKIVFSKNDLEAQFIAELCEEYKEDVEAIDLGLDWGEDLHFSHAKIRSLLDSDPCHIILIEIPSPKLEKRLRDCGHNVDVVDHHAIITPEIGHIDRFAQRSSVEQLVAYMGWELSKDNKKRLEAVAANDVGGWFGLMKHFSRLDMSVEDAMKDAKSIRDEEKKIRLKCSTKEVSSKSTNTNQNIHSPDTFEMPRVVERRLHSGLGKNRGSDFYFNVYPTNDLEERAEDFQRNLAKKLHEKITADIEKKYKEHNDKVDKKEKINKRKPYELWKSDDEKAEEIFNARISLDAPEMLFLGLKPLKTIEEKNKKTKKLLEAQIEKLFFTCGPAGVAVIQDIIDQKKHAHKDRLSIVTGGTKKRAYLYASGDEAALSELANIILDNCLHGQKPLRAWQTTFFQALAIPKDALDPTSKKLHFKICRHTKYRQGCSCCQQLQDLQADENEKIKEKPRDFFKDYDLRLQSMFGLVETSKSARNYLLPALRPNMAPTINEAKTALNAMDLSDNAIHPILSWNIPLDDNWCLTLANLRTDEIEDRKIIKVDDDGQHLTAKFKALTLHWAYDNTIFLEWRFSDETLNKTDSLADSSWRYLISDTLDQENKNGGSNLPADAISITCVGQAIDFNYGARQCYSAGKRGESDQRRISLIINSVDGKTNHQTSLYTDFGLSEDETTQLSGWFAVMADEAFSHFKRNFCPALTHKNKGVKLLLDERARFVSTIVPIGQQPSLPSGIFRGEVIEARFAGGDDFSEYHFYNRDFAMDELNRGKYSRFSPSTTYYCTSHSFSLITYGWFGENIALVHMREHYARMFLILQASVSIFQKLWSDLIEVTGNESRARQDFDRDKLSEIAVSQRKKMVQFSNIYWFRSLSSQLQGEEIFEKMRSALPVEREHDDLNDEIADTERVLEAERLQKAENDRNLYAFMFGILAAFVALFELSDKFISWGIVKKYEATDDIDNAIIQWLDLGAGSFALVLFVLGLVLVISSKKIYAVWKAIRQFVTFLFN